MILVRKVFDEYNLISALHTYLSIEDNKFKNLLPPLVLLNDEDRKELLKKLNKYKFLYQKKNLAA